MVARYSRKFERDAGELLTWFQIDGGGRINGSGIGKQRIPGAHFGLAGIIDEQVRNSTILRKGAEVVAAGLKLQTVVAAIVGVRLRDRSVNSETSLPLFGDAVDGRAGNGLAIAVVDASAD